MATAHFSFSLRTWSAIALRGRARTCNLALQSIVLISVVLGSRLWLIASYSTPVPILDQWDSEGAQLFKPWLQGHLTLTDLFRPNNEHRMVLSRILSIILLWLNGQWDGRLEMVLSSVICCASALLLAAILIRFTGARQKELIITMVAVWFALPYGHENTLWGLQSAFYLLVLFSIISIWGLICHCAFTRRWWLALVGLLLACLTMATGFLAAVVISGMKLLQCLRRRSIKRGDRVTLLLCTILILIGVCLRTTVPEHAVLRSSGLVWLHAFFRCLAWPFSDSPILSIWTYLPIICVICVYVHQNRGRQDRSIVFTEGLVAITMWVVLQMAIIAWARGGGTVPLPVSRYMDILAVGSVANGAACLWLLNKAPIHTRWHSVLAPVAAVWIAGVAFGIVRVSQREMRPMQPRRDMALFPIEQNLRAYVATGNAKFLEGNPAPSLPYPDPKRLRQFLDDPALRSILPAVIRSPLRLVISESSNFFEGGYPPKFPNPSSELSWGSYTNGPGSPGAILRTEPVNVRFPYLEFEVAGVFDEKVTLGLESTDPSRCIPAVPLPRNNIAWRLAETATPSRQLRIVAQDKSATGWIAFHQPRELARLSHHVFRVAGAGRFICVCGLILWITLLLHWHITLSSHGSKAGEPRPKDPTRALDK